MTLSDLYKKNVELTGFFMQKAQNTQDWEARDSFNVRALTHQERAGRIAHCIAMFGNLPLDEIDVSALNQLVQDIPCRFGNPWVHGLNLVADARSS